MAQSYTKQLIRRKFIECLEKEPISRISVKEIAELCEINRNTFYYYYKDIYAVLEDVLTLELEQVMKDYHETDRWEDGFLRSASFALEHKNLVNHVYHSLQREDLERFLFSIAGLVMERYVADLNKGIGAPKEDEKLIAYFYQSALTETVLQWIGRGMNEDVTQMIIRIGKLFDGNIEISLRRSLDIH